MNIDIHINHIIPMCGTTFEPILPNKTPNKPSNQSLIKDKEYVQRSND